MKRYEPSPTISRVLQNYRQKRVTLLLGPIGGGKTVGMLVTLLDWATRQEPNKDGVRNTRFAVVRNTRPQLRDSVLKTIQAWLPFDDPRVSWADTQMVLTLRYGLADGTRLNSEIMFRALDDEADAAKLLSVEYTGFWLSEFREIPLTLLTDIRSRAGRYPAIADVPPTHHGVIGESNFPIKGSEWHDLMEVRMPDWLQVFKQPSALSAEAENKQFLAPGYYEELLTDSTEAWQQAHIKCEYPESSDGQSVFGKSFSRERHVAKQPLRPIVGITHGPPIILGVDQGRSPGALFCQLDGRGRLNVYREAHASNIGMRAFAAEHIVPTLQKYFFNVPVIVVADPAAAHKTEVDDETPLDVLRAAGLHCITAPTNVISRRIEAVERILSAPDGVTIDPECVELIAALSYRYRFKKKRDGSLEDILPEKKHPWSDLADCLQYVALSAGGVQYGRVLKKTRAEPARVVRPSAGAWT